MILPPGSKILFITAAPADEAPLDHSREHSAIREAVRGKFTLATWLAAQPEDLILGIQAERPAVVHFSGHGTGKEGLVFQQENGTANLFASKAMDALLNAKELMAPVRLMVLNACFTFEQAKVISKQGPDTIAMKRDVLDSVAVAFSQRFYRALFDDLSPQGALPAAIAAMEAEGLPEADTPQFYAGQGAGATIPIRTQKKVPTGPKVIRRAVLDFLANLPEETWNDLVFENQDFQNAHGFALKHSTKKEAVRKLIVWIEERNQDDLEPLLEQVRAIAPDHFAQCETGLYQA